MAQERIISPVSYAIQRSAWKGYSPKFKFVSNGVLLEVPRAVGELGRIESTSGASETRDAAPPCRLGSRGVRGP
jgi:hypothetical protein